MKISPEILIEDYWILRMPEIFLTGWNRLNSVCLEYYKNVSNPYYLKHKK
ncbi:hypothetical protein [Clostridium sp. HBUAS56017]|nr:hypothetical protein [Clostridium sp. HBUAS56017]